MSVAEAFASMAYGPAPETAQAALAWIAEHTPATGLFIGGEWVAGAETFSITNPATGRHLIDATQAGAAEVDAAVRAARAAFPAWSSLPGHARARYLYALARLIQKHSRLFAVLETLDNGKPIRETRDLDIPLVARHFSYHAGWAQLLATELPGRTAIGVCGQIIPWNFPLLMLAWKVAPALAAGNTVVIKPAEYTPLTAILFAEIAQQAGLPAGVLNVVTGDGRTGELIVDHPDVDKIAFTGSTEVGRIIRRQTAGTGKKLTLELGGKSPFVVFEDADLDSVVEGVVDAIWFNQGQVCCAGSRLLVQESVAGRLTTKLRDRMERLRIGDPLDKAVDIGAIVSPQQLDRVRSLVDQGVREGAEIWQPSWACPTEGYWFPPTLFTNVAPAATIAQVEIFGPVLISMTFRTPDEAVALANNTPYGLAASVWTENVNTALDIATRLQAGVVWVNSTNQFDASAGFGGYHESGFGREGGREGMLDYTSPGSWVLSAEKTNRDTTRAAATPDSGPSTQDPALPAIDRTPKLFIGGKQARPDSGYSRAVVDAAGRHLGEVGEGNRKDVRNAIEAARGAAGWSGATAHNRAQVLFYLAENLSARATEFSDRLARQIGRREDEVDRAIDRLFAAAAWADKYSGRVQGTPWRGLTVGVHEPIGVVGIVCPVDRPLEGLLALAGMALAMGNRVVVVPSEAAPLTATDLYSVLETSDVPAGAFNIITGDPAALGLVLADHDDVDALWYLAGDSTAVERASAGNLKRVWTGPWPCADEDLLRQAVQVKNIWIPSGA